MPAAQGVPKWAPIQALAWPNAAQHQKPHKSNLRSWPALAILTSMHRLPGKPTPLLSHVTYCMLLPLLPKHRTSPSQTYLEASKNQLFCRSQPVCAILQLGGFPVAAMLVFKTLFTAWSCFVAPLLHFLRPAINATQSLRWGVEMKQALGLSPNLAQTKPEPWLTQAQTKPEPSLNLRSQDLLEPMSLLWPFSAS